MFFCFAFYSLVCKSCWGAFLHYVIEMTVTLQEIINPKQLAVGDCFVVSVHTEILFSSRIECIISKGGTSFCEILASLH